MYYQIAARNTTPRISKFYQSPSLDDMDFSPNYQMLVLFFGAFFDALIGPNLVVQGEPFLLAAGCQLHGGVISGAVAVVCGGFLGDQCSWYIGRRAGVSLQQWLWRRQPRTRRLMARCRMLMRRRTEVVLVCARLLGPVAWVTPFLAGMERIGWLRFTLCSGVGLLLGMGQFLAAGWLLAAGVQRFPWFNSLYRFFSDNTLPMLLLLCGGIAVVALLRWWRGGRES